MIGLGHCNLELNDLLESLFWFRCGLDTIPILNQCAYKSAAWKSLSRNCKPHQLKKLDDTTSSVMHFQPRNRRTLHRLRAADQHWQVARSNVVDRKPLLLRPKSAGDKTITSPDFHVSLSLRREPGVALTMASAQVCCG